MRTLRTLIRIEETKTGDLTRELRALEQASKDLEHQIKVLEDERAKSKTFCESADWKALQDYAPFSERIQQDINNLRKSLKSAQQKENHVRSQLQDIYSEQKKFEQTMAERKKERLKQLEKQEDLEIDDLMSLRGGKKGD